MRHTTNLHMTTVVIPSLLGITLFVGYCCPAAAQATLVSVAVTPTNQTVSAGSTLQFKANGTFSDGSTQDITDSVTWTASYAFNLPAVTITSTGLATGLGDGTSTITATLGAVRGFAYLNVNMTSITVTAIGPTSIPLGQTARFQAFGNFVNFG